MYKVHTSVVFLWILQQIGVGHRNRLIDTTPLIPGLDRQAEKVNLRQPFKYQFSDIPPNSNCLIIQLKFF